MLLLLAGAPAEQSVKINVPAQTQLYLDQVLYSVSSHTSFQTHLLIALLRVSASLCFCECLLFLLYSVHLFLGAAFFESLAVLFCFAVGKRETKLCGYAPRLSAGFVFPKITSR